MSQGTDKPREMTLGAIRKRFEAGSWDHADLQWMYERAEAKGEGEAFFYLVVRTYRHKRHVRFISIDQPEAEGAYNREAAKLRDGDLALWRCVRGSVIARTSGGYNRTKW